MTPSPSTPILSRIGPKVNPQVDIPDEIRQQFEDVDLELGPPGSLIIDDPLLRGGFIQAPRGIHNHPDLTLAERWLYESLLGYAWEKDSAFPGHARLAAEMGRSVSTVYRTIQSLRAKGLISWTRRGQGLTNIYHILSLRVRGGKVVVSS